MVARTVAANLQVRRKTKKLASKGTGKLKRVVTPPDEVGKRDEIDVLWTGEFAKADSDKQQIFGWASVVEVNGEPVVDLQGDYISVDEMEKAAYTYVTKSRKGGDMHLRDDWNPIQKSEMIESFVDHRGQAGRMDGPAGLDPDWLVGGLQGVRPRRLVQIKSGERTGFSIHGRGQQDATLMATRKDHSTSGGLIAGAGGAAATGGLVGGGIPGVQGQQRHHQGHQAGQLEEADRSRAPALAAVVSSATAPARPPGSEPAVQGQRGVLQGQARYPGRDVPARAERGQGAGRGEDHPAHEDGSEAVDSRTGRWGGRYHLRDPSGQERRG